MSSKPPKKVLIIEDDEDLHLLYRLYLQGESYKILQARNGKEGLEKIAQERPDLIILDMIMPVMDGEEFIQKFRFEDKIFDIPIIIASVNDKVPPSLIEKGKIHTVLKKPFPIEVLLREIETALKGH
jgi:CheY-like chemotaxis protein